MDSYKHRNQSCTSNNESYGWVFNHSDNVNDSHLQSFPISSKDSVFLDTPKLNSTCKNGSVSFTKDQNSKRTWAPKRKSIQEIIPRRPVFSDNYFQYPEFSYGSYRKTMLPRIKYTFVIHPNTSAHCLDQTKNKKNESVLNNRNRFPSISCRIIYPGKTRCATINRSIRARNVNENTYKHSVHSQNVPFMSNCHVFDTENIAHCPECYNITLQGSNSNRNTMNNAQLEITQQSSYESLDIHCNHCHKSKKCLGNEKNTKTFDYSNTEYDKARRGANSVSYDFETETLKPEAEMNLTVNHQESFKTISNREYKLRNNNQKNIMRKYSLSEDIPLHNLPSDSMPGQVVPITIQKTSLSKMNSFPISPHELGNLKNKTVKFDFQNKGRVLCSSTSSTDFQANTNVKHRALKREEAFKSELNHQISVSPTQENLDELQNFSSKAALTATGSIQDLKEKDTNHEVTGIQENKHSCVKRKPVVRFPSILTGCPTGPDGQTDVTNLIMDEDSLVGLSEEELLGRTSRIRQLRKFVEIRSKERKKKAIHSNRN